MFVAAVEVGLVPPALKEMLIVAQQVLNCEVPPLGPGGVQSDAVVADAGQFERSVVEVSAGNTRPRVSVIAPCEFVFMVTWFPFGSSIFVSAQVEKKYLLPCRSQRVALPSGELEAADNKYPVASTDRYCPAPTYPITCTALSESVILQYLTPCGQQPGSKTTFRP